MEAKVKIELEMERLAESFLPPVDSKCDDIMVFAVTLDHSNRDVFAFEKKTVVNDDGTTSLKWQRKYFIFDPYS